MHYICKATLYTTIIIKRLNVFKVKCLTDLHNIAY